MTTLGQNLRTLRKTHGVSQPALAEKSGVAQPTISDIERGRREPHHSTLKKLADALNVPVAAFFQEDGSPRVPPPPTPPIADSTPEALETKLYGAPAAEVEGPLRPVLSEPEAMELSDSARRELDALEDWIRQFAHAPPDEKFERRADHDRVRELLKRARFYHAWLFNAWSKLYDPRPVPFQSAEQFARESDGVVADFVAAMQSEAERQRIEQSGKAG